MGCSKHRYHSRIRVLLQYLLQDGRHRNTEQTTCTILKLLSQTSSYKVLLYKEYKVMVTEQGSYGYILYYPTMTIHPVPQ